MEELEDSGTQSELLPEAIIDEIEPEAVIEEIPIDPYYNIPNPIPPRNHTIESDVVMISIGRELKEHYDVVLSTRDEILGAPDETGGAKAAILNATTGIIKDLAKLQMEIYNSDLISRLQQAIMNALEDVSPEIKEKVLKSLEKRLEGI